jgi:ribosomal protein L11 methyltransferase
MFRFTLLIPLSRIESVTDLLDSRGIPCEIGVEPLAAPGRPGIQLQRVVFYAEDEATSRAWNGLLLAHGLADFLQVDPYTWDPALWVEKWKEFYDWTRISDGLAVGPAFKPCPFQVNVTLPINPGQAFGSGTHESTRICLSLLERYLSPGTPVLDAGCGTGVLAIAALKLGASQVLAFDIEQRACLETAENAAANGVRPDIYRGGIETAAGEFPLVLANLLPHLLVALKLPLQAVVAPGGLLVLSGITVKEQARFERQFFADGPAFECVERQTIEEWYGSIWRRATP